MVIQLKQKIIDLQNEYVQLEKSISSKITEETTLLEDQLEKAKQQNSGINQKNEKIANLNKSLTIFFIPNY